VPRTVIAQKGDTLWDIARTIVPKGSIGDLVSDMVRLNGSHIEPGQVIRIP
jgi:nucleoid-associated protein YgaU